MKILVCVKQVPDMESKFTVNADGSWYDDLDLVWRMNEYDEFAVEQAIQLKETVGEADITVLSVGNDRVKESIKKALSMGCDRGVHIQDSMAYTKDPFEVASIIAEFARGKGFDLIFTGMQSQDRGSAQVGVLVAEILGSPCISTIIEFAYKDNEVIVRRELEGGIKAIVKTRLPAVMTCQLGLNTPRYPTLPNIMKAKKKELLEVAVSELHKVAAVQKTDKTYFPKKKGGGVVIESDADSLADQLIKIIKEKTVILG